MSQIRTSANTSTRTVNRIYKRLVEDLLPKGSTIVDYGCGKYNDNKEYAEANGYEWWGMDLYNRTAEENAATEDRFDLEYPDIILCNNVLNVIDDEKTMEDIMKNLSLDSDAIKWFFTIYEGDKSGIGKESKEDCWQRNEKTKDYIPRLKKYFKRVEKLKGESNIIMCSN